MTNETVPLNELPSEHSDEYKAFQVALKSWSRTDDEFNQYHADEDAKCYEEFIALYNPLNIRLVDPESTIKQQFVFAGWELAWKKIRQPVSLETCLNATARFYANWHEFNNQPASLRELVKCVLDTARIDYVN